MVEKIQLTTLLTLFLVLALKIYEQMIPKKKLKKKIILSSKAAGGKDFFRTFLIAKGLKPSISYTTRDIRKGEVEGVDYHYIEEKE